MNATEQVDVVSVNITRNGRGFVEGWEVKLTDGSFVSGWFEQDGEPGSNERNRISNDGIGMIDAAYHKCSRGEPGQSNSFKADELVTS